MNIYTFYYKAETEISSLPYTKTGQEKFMATNPNNAYFKFINWAENNGLYILDFDTETQEIEEEREF
jgi:hypothetical protein